MAYFVPADTPLNHTEHSTTQEVTFHHPTAPRTPAVHQSASKARPIRVVSMGDGPHGKQVVCEFLDGWQRSIDLPTEADAWHPLFNGLPHEQRLQLHRLVKPVPYVDGKGVRKQREELSFTTTEIGPRGGCKKFNHFDVPDEEYGVGQITGYRAAVEMLEALQRAYGPHVSLGPILRDVFAAEGESARSPSRRGAVGAFAEVIEGALEFFAKNAKHGPWIAGKVAQAESVNAHYDKQAADDKAAFVQRMKDAKAAKRSKTLDA